MTDKLNLNKGGKVPRLPQLNNSLPKLPGTGLKGASPLPVNLSKASSPSPSSDANVSVGAAEPAACEAPAPQMSGDMGQSSVSPEAQPTGMAAPMGMAPAAPMGMAPASGMNPAATMGMAPASGMNPAVQMGMAPASGMNPAVQMGTAPASGMNPAVQMGMSPNASDMNPAAAIPLSPAPQEDNSPVFGGAATSDETYDEEEGEDAGEKTMMLGAAMDDEDELDLGGEKTQITMSAMDFDPLSGKLIVESGKAPQREYILVRDKTRIGRAPKNDIAISDISMSREHVEIDKFPEGFRVRDLDSGNGTVLNGYRIRVGQLRNGDTIEVGSIRFRFEQSGGDPDVLWRGEPKIEYHPNQQKKTGGGAPSAANMSAAPSASGSGSPQIPAPQAPQMESMLQRQGGGIAAPSWTGAPPMTSPYMMTYGANALRNVNTTPLWANIVLAALIVVCVGSFIWLAVAGMQKSAGNKEIEEREELIALISKDVEDGISAYSNLNFTTALEKLDDAAERDKDETIVKDRELFDFYRKLITQEEDINKEIKKIRIKGKDIPISEFEDDLRYLNDVSDSSVNKKLAISSINGVHDNFKAVLKTKIRQLVADNKLSEARSLLDKLRTLPDTANDVRQLNKFIGDKEKTLD